MTDELELFEKRKQDHIQLALESSHQAFECNRFDLYDLVHEAIPDLNFDDIDISTRSLGHMRVSPFFISSMTAGHEHAQKINGHLLTACQDTGWCMGVGSQRRELMEQTSSEWTLLRKRHPNVSLFANIGIAQLIATPISNLRKLVDVITAEALIIHCNPLQELIQPEGTVQFEGSWNALENLVKHLHVPVIVKETGCGFSCATLQRLNQLGVQAIDVGGSGGTHWGRIEGSRVKNDMIRARAAKTFANWGIPTVTVLSQAKELLLQSEIWGSGGIRNGLDAAKALVLGATQVGIAKPILAAALQNEKAVVEIMRTYEYELKVAMFCTNSQNIKALKKCSLQVL